MIVGGARVCRGAWRYAPLPQREVGNLALLRRSRNHRVAVINSKRHRRLCRHAVASQQQRSRIAVAYTGNHSPFDRLRANGRGAAAQQRTNSHGPTTTAKLA